MAPTFRFARALLVDQPFNLFGRDLVGRVIGDDDLVSDAIARFHVR
jgi:predicted methyltransferase